MCGGYNIFIYFRDLYYIFWCGFLICTCSINPSLGLHLDTLVLLLSESKSIVKNLLLHSYFIICVEGRIYLYTLGYNMLVGIIYLFTLFILGMIYFEWIPIRTCGINSQDLHLDILDSLISESYLVSSILLHISFIICVEGIYDYYLL